MTDAQIPVVVVGETYPIMLLNDALRLVEAAADGKTKRKDNRPVPSTEERAMARAAIFTAFNLLESLFVELTQDAIRNGRARCVHCANTILDELRCGRAGIARTMTEWPIKILGACVAGKAEFGRFKEIRTLRNQLIHPKLETQESGERSQDDLLKECTADRCRDILYEVARMCKLLYTEFGQPVPPEFEHVLRAMKP